MEQMVANSDVTVNGTHIETIRRGRGRPRGSKNKTKFLTEGWSHEKTSTYTRKWQRVQKLKPQFSLTRKDAYEILFSYLRSVKGKAALKEILISGTVGVGKLSDTSLGQYLEKTNLLSRYPHDVIIKG